MTDDQRLDAEVRSEAVDIGTGEYVKVTVSFPLGVPGESGRVESVLVFPARLTHAVIASILGALKG